MKGKQRAGGLERLSQQVGRLVADRYTPARLRRDGESLVEVHAMALQELSTTFTSAREELPPGYLDRPQMRAAYLLYYLPVGVATAQAAMRLSGVEARLRGTTGGTDPAGGPSAGARGALAPLRVLDLGAGPLTASLAVALSCPDRALEVVALDRSARALEDGQALMAGLRPDAAVRVERRDLRDRDLLKGLGGARFDLVVIGHALNELRAPGRDGRRRGPSAEETAAALCGRLLEKAVAPGGHLLVYEPGTRGASQRLIAVREALLERTGVQVVAPCMGAMTCPLSGEDARSWCHAEQPWQRPSLVEACDRAIGHRRTSLKLSYLALTQTDAAAGGEADRARQEPAQIAASSGGAPAQIAGASGGAQSRAYRIIGGPMKARGRLRRYLCGAQGRVVAEEREADLPAHHWLHQAWRGDQVTVTGAAESARDRRGGDPVLRVRAGGPGSAAPHAVWLEDDEDDEDDDFDEPHGRSERAWSPPPGRGGTRQPPPRRDQVATGDREAGRGRPGAAGRTDPRGRPGANDRARPGGRPAQPDRKQPRARPATGEQGDRGGRPAGGGRADPGDRAPTGERARPGGRSAGGARPTPRGRKPKPRS